MGAKARFGVQNARFGILQWAPEARSCILNARYETVKLAPEAGFCIQDDQFIL